MSRPLVVRGGARRVSFIVKEKDTTRQLLANTESSPMFKGGVFTHSFLAPSDYHRQHAPVAGTVVEAKVIPGICYLEVILQKKDESEPGSGGMKLGMHRYIRHKDDKDLPTHRGHRGVLPSARNGADLDAPDRPGYQFLQARGLILTDNPTLERVAVLPIGMAQVSSVVLSVKKGQTVTKGQEISYFQMGGSDIVMVSSLWLVYYTILVLYGARSTVHT